MFAARFRLPRWLVGSQGFALVATMLLAGHSDGRDDKKATPELKGAAAADLVRLKREIDALETLYQLEPTDTQLNGLLALAQKTAAKPEPVTSVHASEGYRKTLQELRAALTRNDETQVAALYQKLSEIEDKEDIDIDEGFELTDAALKAAPAAVKLFTAAQVVSYLTAMENEIPDPVERIVSVVTEGVDVPAAEWKTLRDETAEEVAWLVVGFNSEAAMKAKVKDVSELLDRGHRFTDKELVKETEGLERAARKLFGEISPTIVIQHYMEREMAELLSNPQTVAAIRARKEPVKK